MSVWQRAAVDRTRDRTPLPARVEDQHVVVRYHWNSGNDGRRRVYRYRTTWKTEKQAKAAVARARHENALVRRYAFGKRVYSEGPPELRETWLLTEAAKHAELFRYVEDIG